MQAVSVIVFRLELIEFDSHVLFPYVFFFFFLYKEEISPIGAEDHSVKLMEVLSAYKLPTCAYQIDTFY